MTEQLDKPSTPVSNLTSSINNPPTIKRATTIAATPKQVAATSKRPTRKLNTQKVLQSASKDNSLRPQRSSVNESRTTTKPSLSSSSATDLRASKEKKVKAAGKITVHRSDEVSGLFPSIHNPTSPDVAETTTSSPRSGIKSFNRAESLVPVSLSGIPNRSEATYNSSEHAKDTPVSVTGSKKVKPTSKSDSLQFKENAKPSIKPTKINQRTLKPTVIGKGSISNNSDQKSKPIPKSSVQKPKTSTKAPPLNKAAGSTNVSTPRNALTDDKSDSVPTPSVRNQGDVVTNTLLKSTNTSDVDTNTLSTNGKINQNSNTINKKVVTASKDEVIVVYNHQKEDTASALGAIHGSSSASNDNSNINNSSNSTSSQPNSRYSSGQMFKQERVDIPKSSSTLDSIHTFNPSAQHLNQFNSAVAKSHMSIHQRSAMSGNAVKYKPLHLLMNSPLHSTQMDMSSANHEAEKTAVGVYPVDQVR